RWTFPPPASSKERLKRNPYFVPAYGIIGSRAGVRRSALLDSVMEATAHALSIDVRTIRLSRYCTGAPSKGIISAETPKGSVVIKLPFRATAVQREERAYA